MTSEFYIRSVAAPGQFSFSLSQEMPSVQLLQLIGGVVRAEPAIDEAARDAPIPAVFVDHAVHDAIDFRLHVYPPKKRNTFNSARAHSTRAVVIISPFRGARFWWCREPMPRS